MLVCFGLVVGGFQPLMAPTRIADQVAIDRRWQEARVLAQPYRTRLRADSVRLTDTLAYQVAWAADRHGVRRELAFRLVWAESRFKVTARGQAGEIGLTQLMPNTARRFCKVRLADLQKPVVNLNCGFKYYASMLERYHGNEWLALVGYNRGPGRADQVRAQGLGYPEKILLASW